MELDDRQRADELDTYWDAVLSGEVPVRPPTVDPLTAEIVRRIVAGPTSSEVEAARLRGRRKILAHTTPHNGAEKTTLPAMALDGYDRVQPARSINQPVVARTRWIPVSIAAMLLIVAVLGYYLRGDALFRDKERHTIPAAVATDPFAEQTLLTLPVASADLPEGLEVAAGITHVSVRPGDDSDWHGNCCPGMRAYYVVSGTLAIRPAGLMSVIKAGSDGGLETVPAGTEISVSVGDTFVARNEVPFESLNPGPEPVNMLLIDLTTQQNDVPSGWMLGAFVGAFDVALPEGPFVFHLTQVELLPNAVYPARPDSIAQMQIALIDTTTGGITSRVVYPEDDWSIVNRLGKTTTFEVLTIALAATDPASRPLESPTT